MLSLLLIILASCSNSLHGMPGGDVPREGNKLMCCGYSISGGKECSLGDDVLPEAVVRVSERCRVLADMGSQLPNDDGSTGEFLALACSQSAS